MQVIFDMRTNEWVKWNEKEHSYLAPELYFEINESPDEYSYHTFNTSNGEKTIKAIDDEDFAEQYKNLQNECTVLYRVSWVMPKDFYNRGLEYFGLK